MLKDKFMYLYNLVNEQLDKIYKNEYYNLSDQDKKNYSFEEYITKEKNKFLNCNEKNKNKYILKDRINKDEILYDLYLINYIHTEPVELDDEYKPVPLEKKVLFEYGLVISVELEEGFFSINNLFNGIEEDKNIAIKKYNEIKNKINDLSNEDVLDLIEKAILEECNS